MNKINRITLERNNKRTPLKLRTQRHHHGARVIAGSIFTLIIYTKAIFLILEPPRWQIPDLFLLAVLVVNCAAMIGYVRRWGISVQRCFGMIYTGFALLTLSWSFGLHIEYTSANIASLSTGTIYLLIGIGVWFLPIIRKRISEKLQSIGYELEVRTHTKTQNKRNLNLSVVGALLVIVILFTAIKLPYFRTSFTGEHNLKYAWSVEIAQHMSEHNSPLWFQTKYVVDPLSNPDGKLKSLDVFPVMEWGLYATYELLPFNSIETNTRLFTHLCGILILLLAYKFFSFFFTRRSALLIVLLLAVNPILIFATYVTVYDSLIMICTLATLIFIEKYVRDKSVASLYVAGVLCGLGIAIKFSMALWLIPIAMLLLMWRRCNWSVFFADSVIFVVLGIVPLVGLSPSLNYLTTSPVIGLFGIGLLAGILIGLYYMLKHAESQYRRLARYLTGFVWVRWGLLGLSIVATIVVIKYTGLSAFNNDFLTDGRLIGNLAMYKYMLFNQFRSYMTPELFYAGIFGMIMILLLRKRNISIVFTSLLAGVLVFWVLASKVIFFHNYYSLIAMFLFAMATSVGIMTVMNITSHHLVKWLALIGALIIILPVNIQAARAHLAENNPYFPEAAEYLKEHTQPGDLYLDDDSASPYFVVKTGVGRVWRSHLSRPEVKASIRRVGFEKTMNTYHIKYLITRLPEPNYSLYVNIFSDAKLESNTVIDRGHLILSTLSGNAEQFSDIDKRLDLIKQNNLPNKFVLEKTIGAYKFYRFAD